MHPYGSFMMCYAKDKWEDAMDAIIKSSIVVPKYCLVGGQKIGSSWADNPSDFEIPNLPKDIRLPNGTSIPVTEDSLTYNFDLDDNSIHCYL